MANIAVENAKKIRPPMDVRVHLVVPSDTLINTYTPSPGYKSYDATLNNDGFYWRPIADLQHEGFPLDGTHRWYEEEQPSYDNGKLGLRGTVEESCEVTITSSTNMVGVMVATRGVASIECNGQTYVATGQDVIYIGGRTATLKFNPKPDHQRPCVDYILPGIDINFTRENLIRCQLSLRTSFDITSTEIPESEIEVQAFWENDISELLKYIPQEGALEYRSGYDDKPATRRFILRENITWKDKILTIRGVDRVGQLAKALKAGDIFNDNVGVVSILDGAKSVNRLTRYVTAMLWDAMGDLTQMDTIFVYTEKTITGPAYRDEMTLRELLQLANLRMFDYNTTNKTQIRYSDAGWPTISVTDKYIGGTGEGRYHRVDMSELGDVSYERFTNVAKITNSSSQELELQLSTPQQSSRYNIEGQQLNTWVDVDFNGVRAARVGGNYTPVSYTPTGTTYIVKADPMQVLYWPITPVETAEVIHNPDGRAGRSMDIQETIHGAFKIGGVNVLSPVNLFRIQMDTISFTYKGNPLWHPGDILWISPLDPDGDVLEVILETIDLIHEGGGTISNIVARIPAIQRGW